MWTPPSGLDYSPAATDTGVAGAVTSMIRRQSRVFAGVLAIALGVVGIVLGAAPAPAAVAPNGAAQPHAVVGVWKPPLEVAATLNLHEQSFNQIIGISCASPGNCSAIGYDEQWESPPGHAFTIDESNGTWGAAVMVADPFGRGGALQFAAISCASAGNCAAVGSYDGENSAFAMDERGGTWQPPVLLADGAFTSVACSGVGQCVAAGNDLGQPFVVSESAGTWGSPQVVLQAPTGYGSGVNSVACGSSGNCVVGGWENYVGGQLAVVADETDGTWGSPHVVADNLNAVQDTPEDSVTAVSCSSAGNCGAGGEYGSRSYQQDFVVSETNGTWSDAVEVAGALNLGDVGSTTFGISSISCPTDGNCAAGGAYFDRNANLGAFVVDETAGTWKSAQEAAGTLNRGWGKILSVSCAAAGNCSAGGFYENAAEGLGGFVVTETNGTWDGGQDVASSPVSDSAAQVNSISCPAPGSCSAGGFYFDSNGYRQAFVVDQSQVTVDSGLSTVSASPSSVPADGASTSTVTVTIKDSGGVAVPGQTVTLAANAGSPSVISAASGPSDANGQVTFTVKDASVESVTYTATDISAAVTVTQTASVSFTPVPRAPSFTAQSPPLTATVGSAYSYTFAASGVPAPTFALAAGAPAWLSVNAATGLVSGTPPAGTASFTYRVIATNGVGSPAGTGFFTVTVNRRAQTVSFTSVPPAHALVGDTYKVTASASSALPVALSIDAASSSGTCSLSRTTVNLLAMGSCVVDANQAGDSTFSPAAQVQQSFGVSPAAPTAPGAPTGVHAVVSGAHVTVSWSAPANHGSAITGYSVAVSPTNQTFAVAATHVTVTLRAGSYTFRVRATNGFGTGPFSVVSNRVTIESVQSTHRSGYWMLASNGQVHGFGNAANLGSAPGPAVAIAPRRDGTGYWTTDAAGNVAHFGTAGSHGGHPSLRAGEVVSTISATPSGNGYWLFTNRGRAFAYGDAKFLGDMSGATLNGPIIASVATPTGNGYFMVGSDGGVFSFGDARFHGSTCNLHLNKPIVGISPTADNRGYWLVASDGGVFAFNAAFRGSMGAVRLSKPVNGLVAFGNGYLMVASDGGVFDFSDKAFLGSLADNPSPAPVIGIAAFTS